MVLRIGHSKARAHQDDGIARLHRQAIAGETCCCGIPRDRSEAWGAGCGASERHALVVGGLLYSKAAGNCFAAKNGEQQPRDAGTHAGLRRAKDWAHRKPRRESLASSGLVKQFYWFNQRTPLSCAELDVCTSLFDCRVCPASLEARTSARQQP
jgi:hypothetical protein